MLTINCDGEPDIVSTVDDSRFDSALCVEEE